MAKLALLLAATAPIVLTVGASANGRTFHLKQSGTLVIRLPANASTGYSWSIARSGAPVLRLRSHAYFAPKTNRLGAAGTYVARFTAATRGTAHVKLVYVRHTHPATPPARVYRLTVVVP